MTVLIDADSLVYVIAWNYREGGTNDEVRASCDTMIQEIVTLTQAVDYIGVFSSKTCFRHEVYKYAPYKGNRPEKEGWLLSWEKLIKEYYENKYGFITVDNLEADDVVAGLAHMFRNSGEPVLICSPDKDLRQVPGYLYAPKKASTEEQALGLQTPQVKIISEEDAHRFFWLQMICGDTSDNVAGVPGLGEVKGKKLLDECLDPMMYPSVVRGAYIKYYGQYYGPIIFAETLDTLMMMNPNHTRWEQYHEVLAQYTSHGKPLKTSLGFFDI